MLAGSRLSRLAEQDEIDFDDEYAYDEEYAYSDEEEDNHHNKPVPIWLSILLRSWLWIKDTTE